MDSNPRRSRVVLQAKRFPNEPLWGRKHTRVRFKWTTPWKVSLKCLAPDIPLPFRLAWFILMQVLLLHLWLTFCCYGKTHVDTLKISLPKPSEGSLTGMLVTAAVFIKTMTLILNIPAKYFVLFLSYFIVHTCRSVMIYNSTISYHPEKDGFPFGVGSSQLFFLVSCWSFSSPLSSLPCS